MGGWCNGISSTDSLNGFVWYTLSCFWNSDMGLGVSLEKQLVELKPRAIRLTYWVAHDFSTVEVACKFPLREIFCKEVYCAGSHWLTLATEPSELRGEEGWFSRWLWVCVNRKIQGMVWSWHGVNGAGMCKRNSITNYVAPCSMCSAPAVLVFMVCAFDMPLLLWGFVKSLSTIQCLFMALYHFKTSAT